MQIEWRNIGYPRRTYVTVMGKDQRSLFDSFLEFHSSQFIEIVVYYNTFVKLDFNGPAVCS